MNLPIATKTLHDKEKEFPHEPPPAQLSSSSSVHHVKSPKVSDAFSYFDNVGPADTFG